MSLSALHIDELIALGKQKNQRAESEIYNRYSKVMFHIVLLKQSLYPLTIWQCFLAFAIINFSFDHHQINPHEKNRFNCSTYF